MTDRNRGSLPSDPKNSYMSFSNLNQSVLGNILLYLEMKHLIIAYQTYNKLIVNAIDALVLNGIKPDPMAIWYWEDSMRLHLISRDASTFAYLDAKNQFIFGAHLVETICIKFKSYSSWISLNPSWDVSSKDTTLWNIRLDRFLQTIGHCTKLKRLEIHKESDQCGTSYLPSSRSELTMDDRSLIFIVNEVASLSKRIKN